MYCGKPPFTREIEKFITRRIWHTTRGHRGRSRQGAGREYGRAWETCLYYGPQVKYFGVSGLKPDWSIQTKTVVLVSFLGVLSKGPTRGRPWNLGENAYHRVFGETYQELTFTCDSVGCYLSCLLREGLGSLQSYCVPCGHTNGC